MIPNEILNYVIIRQIGSGGMGHVFLARNKNIEQYVAIKVLHPRFAGNPLLRQRFKQEAVLLSSLNHPNIVRFLNYVENEHGVFLIMEYVDGMTLEDFISKKNGLIVEDRAFPLIDEILDAFEYAHGRNIVHLDIKPSNIFITRDGHIKVMDFGIAKILSESDPDSNRQTMGTPEFMSPEQVLGRPLDARSDIYSLGVLIHQMLTGRTPYDSTTMSRLEIQQQVINDPLPKMQDYYQYVSDGMQKLVDKATAKLPDKRFRSCADMRREVRGVLRPEPKSRRMWWVGIAAVLVLGVAGFFVWDYFRLKVNYYSDYIEEFGIPKGIGKVSGSDLKHRAATYRMESRRGKPLRLTLVNSAGVPVEQGADSRVYNRFTDVEYFYTDQGNIDYKKVYDQFHRLLFKLDYDENLKTATFKHDDEYGTPMRMLAKSQSTFIGQNNVTAPRSQIVRHLLKFNPDNGRLEELRFAGLNNEPIGDSDNVYGLAFEYDNSGRYKTIKMLGPDGKPRNNNQGLGIKELSYSPEGYVDEVRYYNTDGTPSHNGYNVSVIEFEYDKWGNTVAEIYQSSSGNRVLNKDTESFGKQMEYDDRGFLTKITLVDDKDRPMVNSHGVASEEYENNDEGRPIEEAYYDADGKKCPSPMDDDLYYGARFEYTPRGLVEKVTFLNEKGKPANLTNLRSAIVTWEYDSAGYPVETAFFDEKGNPAKLKGAHSVIRTEYDELHRELSERYFDAKGNPTENESHEWGRKYDYDVAGNLIGITEIDAKGQPVDIHGYFAIARYKFDERGNKICDEFFNAKSEKSVSHDNVHKIERVYDESNQLTEVRYSDTNRLRSVRHNTYDDRGNCIKEYQTDAAGRLDGNVDNYEFDNFNRLIKTWASRLDGTKTNYSGKTYAGYTLKYDDRGNAIEKTFFDAAGRPAVDELDTHRRVHEYDQMNRIVHELNYDRDGKPTRGRNSFAEGRIKYDQRGNTTEMSVYDGNGHPATGATGFHRLEYKYDERNNLIEAASYNVDGKLTVPTSQDYAKVENTYNDQGLLTLSKYYGADGKVSYQVSQDHNDKGQLTELRYLNSNGNLDSSLYFSKIKITYEPDNVTPKARHFYSASGSLIATQKYNSKNDTWI